MAQEEKTKKKNRLSYMILSVIIAIIAWILVVYITDPEITKKFTGIPVEITGENVLAENGFVIVNRDEIPNTSLKMSGRRSDLIKSLDKARVVIDVSQIKDEGEIELETSAKGAKAGVSIEKIGAEMISVSIEKIQSKVVPVRVVQIGTPKNGLVKTEPSDATVEIKGATSELDLVEAVEVKMDITNVVSNEKKELQYSLILKDGVEPEVLYTIRADKEMIMVQNTVYEKKEVPVKINVKTGNDNLILSDETEIDPQSVVVGVSAGINIDDVTVTIDENADEGDYKLDDKDGVYIPKSSSMVHIKPRWE